MADKLSEILSLYSSLDSTSRAMTLDRFNENLIKIIHDSDPHASLEQGEISTFVGGLNAKIGAREIPPLSLLLIEEVFANLLHHASVHTDVRLSDITMDIIGDAHTENRSLLVKYCAQNTPKRSEVLSRVCVSPIKSRQTGRSYHYGLFLLATQLRMAGGYATANMKPIYNRDLAPFEVAFAVPLSKGV